MPQAEDPAGRHETLTSPAAADTVVGAITTERADSVLGLGWFEILFMLALVAAVIVAVVLVRGRR
jgi:hypothetical protein